MTPVDAASIRDQISFSGCDKNHLVFLCILLHQLRQIRFFCFHQRILGCIHPGNRSTVVQQCLYFRIISPDTGRMDYFHQLQTFFTPIGRPRHPDRINHDRMSQRMRPLSGSLHRLIIRDGPEITDQCRCTCRDLFHLTGMVCHRR